MNRRELMQAAIAAPLAAALPAVAEKPVYGLAFEAKWVILTRMDDGSWVTTWEGTERPGWAIISDANAGEPWRNVIGCSITEKMS